MESPLCPGDTIQNDPAFRLIETLGWRPAEGFRNREGHLTRMARSAGALGLRFNRQGAEQMLDEVQGATPLRCRLTMDATGSFDLTTAPLTGAPSLWRIALAEVRLDPDDVWLRHKTTRRAVYDRARAELREGVDELLFLNTRSELCEGTITNVFVTSRDGRMLTPSLGCGLLPGVLRQHLLDSGQAQEAVLTIADLEQAAALHMGNSLRGLIPVQLA